MTMTDAEVITGDCRQVLAGMAAESVHMVMTSPPYWGLRDYGIELNPEYVAMARKRLEGVTSGMALG